MYLDQDSNRIGGPPDLRGLPAKELVGEIRSVVVTSIVDHRAIQASVLTIRLAFLPEAGKKPDSVTPQPADKIYRRIDVERQVLEASGAWSEWQPVDLRSNVRVLNNLREEDTEHTPRQFETSTYSGSRAGMPNANAASAVETRWA